MYRKQEIATTDIKRNESTQDVTLERKIEAMLNNGEPTGDKAPIIYTPRAEGVKPSYNIRTDRWEVAVDGMDKIHKSITAKRDEIYQGKVVELNPDKVEEKTGE